LRSLARAARAPRSRRVRIDDLRDAHGTLLRRLGADIRTVQDPLCHADLRISSALYVDVVGERLRAASELWETAVEPERLLRE
jgi:site-specific recombinase XerD